MFLTPILLFLSICPASAADPTELAAAQLGTPERLFELPGRKRYTGLFRENGGQLHFRAQNRRQMTKRIHVWQESPETYWRFTPGVGLERIPDLPAYTGITRSPDQHHGAQCRDTLTLFSLSDEATLATLDDSCEAARFSPDGARLLVTTPHTTTLYTVPGLEPIWTLDIPAAPYGKWRFSPSGSLLCRGSSRGAFVDAETGTLLATFSASDRACLPLDDQRAILHRDSQAQLVALIEDTAGVPTVVDGPHLNLPLYTHITPTGLYTPTENNRAMLRYPPEAVRAAWTPEPPLAPPPPPPPEPPVQVLDGGGGHATTQAFAAAIALEPDGDAAYPRVGGEVLYRSEEARFAARELAYQLAQFMGLRQVPVNTWPEAPAEVVVVVGERPPVAREAQPLPVPPAPATPPPHPRKPVPKRPSKPAPERAEKEVR